MRNNETGEIELVVGNRQLLSGFFIVVLLCAVAFAMGYVVGQNSPHSAKASETSSVVSVSPSDSRPMPASPAPPIAQPPAPQPTDGAAPTGTGSDLSGAAPPADAPPAPTTKPSRDVESQAAAAPPPAPAPAAPAEAAAEGVYWQVSAIANPDAVAAMQQTLKDAGFPVVLGAGPKNLTRVLVGPYTDTASMARAKTALEKAGFRPVKH